MKKIILYIFLLISIQTFGQTKVIFNQTEFDYKGDVQTVLMESYEPITQNGEITGFRYEGGLFGLGTQKIFFDNEGKVLEKYEYETKCGGDSIQIDKIWNYYYTQSRLDSVIRSEVDTFLIRRGFKPWKFYYDYKSDTIYYEIRDLSFKRTNKVRVEQNREIKEFLSKDSIVTTTEISHYDSLKRQIKFEIYKKGELSAITIFNYPNATSEMANLIYTIDLKKNTVSRKEHQFNDRGDIVKTTIYKPNGEYMTHWSFKYEYDDFGNWIRKEKYNRKEKMINMYKQTIKYRTSR